MPSSSNRREEKHSLLTDETEDDSCLEGSSGAPSVDQESGTVSAKNTLLWWWRSVDPAWKSWSLFAPPVLVFLILSYLAFFPPSSSSSSSSSGEACPKTMDMSGYVCAPNGALPKIARERGCEFDTMSFKWWPRAPTTHRDNVALVDEFHAQGPWHRYYDKGGKHEIPPTTEVLTAGWVSRREHTVHCVYTLRQTHLWIALGYDPPFNYTHTIHCTKYLMDTILENPPKDFDDLTVHGTPWPEHPAIVSCLEAVIDQQVVGASFPLLTICLIIRLSHTILANRKASAANHGNCQDSRVKGAE
ncbi:hypothetical protein CTA2_11471 [Colletotrichum tanaceti]|uniref:Uncharacterized protein n=1 Tax=Colletotrichum tanaceti TaxID=1306861 RepID=A0A4U6XE49_9PEZI|nr:hypothetical protein CTA2_11464 [Colletotrichum tanaceti]KAJ0167989.1 hypothetical protein CTA2_11471 [Colletotrichum tanaceti]TKW52147.1 hypothetical protein CTA1_8574 [Colletotrichum tanaceti]